MVNAPPVCREKTGITNLWALWQDWRGKSWITLLWSLLAPGPGRGHSGGEMTAATTQKSKPNESRSFPDPSAMRDAVAAMSYIHLQQKLLLTPSLDFSLIMVTHCFIFLSLCIIYNVQLPDSGLSLWGAPFYMQYPFLYATQNCQFSRMEPDSQDQIMHYFNYKIQLLYIVSTSFHIFLFLKLSVSHLSHYLICLTIVTASAAGRSIRARSYCVSLQFSEQRLNPLFSGSLHLKHINVSRHNRVI